MDETEGKSEIKFTGGTAYDTLHGGAEVLNPGDLTSPVTVTVRHLNQNWTVQFRRPDQATEAFEDKHMRRIRKDSVTKLTSNNASSKIQEYANTASKRSGQRWNNGAGLNSLVFLTLDGFCKLGAHIVDKSKNQPRHPFRGRQQVHLTITMPECLAFTDNGYGQATNSGVGVVFEITVEEDPAHPNILYVVHLAGANAQNRIAVNKLTDKKYAPNNGRIATTVGGGL